MSLRLYNTLTRQKDLFEPVRPGKVGMYLCGPTVYKEANIGHMVGPVIFDAIKRYLVYSGYAVTWVVNTTDVDDKLIAEATRRMLDQLVTNAPPKSREAEALKGRARHEKRMEREVRIRTASA